MLYKYIYDNILNLIMIIINNRLMIVIKYMFTDININQYTHYINYLYIISKNIIYYI